MIPIWYEILPVTLESNHIVLLRRHEDGEELPWLAPHQPGIHPNEGVLRHLAAFFGEVFEPRGSIVHSTSWRYSSQDEQLILTYLVVLPQRSWTRCWAAAGRILLQPLGAIEQVGGNHLYPPERIEVVHVLAHALDHLAWLGRYDVSIKAVLSTEWLEALRTRSPRPAGHFPFYSTVLNNLLVAEGSTRPAHDCSDG